MINIRTLRGVSGLAAAALVLSGASLTLAMPAIAVEATAVVVTPSDINVDETEYLGWHEGYVNEIPAFAVEWDGLHLGNGAPSQILKGLVNTHEAGVETTSADLAMLIEQSAVSIVSGELVLQVPVTTADGWATLRTNDFRTSASEPTDRTELWTSSRDIGDVVKDAPVELGTLLDALEAQGDLRYSAFGILAIAPAVVTDLAFDGTTYSFHTVVTGPEFTDVAASPFKDDIAWLRTAGITTPAELFRPTAVMSRQAMAAFLYRVAGSPEFVAPPESPFTDVAVGNTFYLPIAWLKAEGITTVTTFRPEDSVSRMAMAAYLYRAEGSPTFVEPSLSPFLDLATDGLFFKEISWLADVDISNGYAVNGGAEYQSGTMVSRQAIAAFVHRAYAL